MSVQREMTVGRVLLSFPELYGPLMELGLCCVSEETVMWSMDRLAADIGCDAAELVVKLNDKLKMLRKVEEE